MKIKRLKHTRKVMNFYRTNFGITAPYSVLIDGTFCKSALLFKISINEQLPKYLDAEVKLCTTRCCLNECESLGTMMYGPLKILRQFQLVECKHETVRAVGSCLFNTARKNQRYFVATQDSELSEKVRKKGGIPLLYISHNTINLETPSNKSEIKAKTKLDEKLVAPSEHQQERLKQLKILEFGEQEEITKKKKKKRGGPNPLSCKKKKLKPSATAVAAGTQNNPITDKKRSRKRRKRIKLSEHVKQTIKTSTTVNHV
ncbi:rRNA-processing protein UTP23 homolog [Tubulanus polymorphus]|uniref:rRNA-processing protein UTP23 homolog n=1 Tax=Tubulanus polymorphus TaxID=672921 RepID=UPI003DA5AAB5